MNENLQSKVDQLYGQIAALEQLVISLFLVSPQKSEVQKIFTRQTERNTALDLYTNQPEEFLKGFSLRQEMLAKILAAGASES